MGCTLIPVEEALPDLVLATLASVAAKTGGTPDTEGTRGIHLPTTPCARKIGVRRPAASIVSAARMPQAEDTVRGRVLASRTAALHMRRTSIARVPEAFPEADSGTGPLRRLPAATSDLQEAQHTHPFFIFQMPNTRRKALAAEAFGAAPIRAGGVLQRASVAAEVSEEATPTAEVIQAVTAVRNIVVRFSFPSLESVSRLRKYCSIGVHCVKTTLPTPGHPLHEFCCARPGTFLVLPSVHRDDRPVASPVRPERV